jgi:hypothetical protein
VTHPTHGSLRVIRAAVVGAVAFALSWAAHVAAGGSSPGAGALALLAVLTGLGSTLVTGWRLRPVALVATLGVAQVALHEALMWLSAPQPSLCAGAMPCGSAMPGMPGMLSAPGMPGMPGLHTPPAHGSSALMLAAHAAATVLLALLLSVGERALWFLATLLRPVLCAWPEPPAMPPSTLVRTHSHVARTGPLPFVSGGTGRRGPPRPGFALAV